MLPFTCSLHHLLVTVELQQVNSQSDRPINWLSRGGGMFAVPILCNLGIRVLLLTNKDIE